MFECVFCDKKFSADVDLKKHEEVSHSQGMFQCVACTDVISLFNNYQEVKIHSTEVHMVDVDIVIQSSVFLPKDLIKFKCVACKNDQKQYLDEEHAKDHLKNHSPFFAKHSEKYLVSVCRICSQTLQNEQKEIDQHFMLYHPFANFASDEDVKDNRNNAKEKENQSKWDVDKSTDSDREFDSSALEAPEDKVYDTIVIVDDTVNGNNPETKIKQEIKTEEVGEDVKPKVPNVTVKAEVLEKWMEENLKPVDLGAKVEGQQKSKTDSSGPRAASQKPRDTRFSSDRSSSLPSVSSRHKSSCLRRASAEDRYSSVLVPLPVVNFSRSSMFFECTVCPKAVVYHSLVELERHRETEGHRMHYGKCFKGNEFRHFPDGAQFNYHRPTCSWCLKNFKSFSDLFLHVRTHEMPERVNYHNKLEYCLCCKMQTFSASHYADHWNGVAFKKTLQCDFCRHRVFRHSTQKHNDDAHSDMYFRCKMDNCSEKGRRFMYPNSLLTHQIKDHKSKSLLNSTNTHFPRDLVRIKCQLCNHKILYNGKDDMLDHLKAKHKDYTSGADKIDFMCRVCNWRDDTAEDVIEHAKTHLQTSLSSSIRDRVGHEHRSSSYQSSSRNKKRSYSRSRSPLTKKYK